MIWFVNLDEVFMKFVVAGMLWFFGITQAVAETQQDIQLEIEAAKRSVLEISNELAKIESELISPNSTKASLYVAINGGNFFKPMSIEVTGAGISPINYVYTELELKALKLGAVQPLGQMQVAPGAHWVRIVIQGQDEREQVRDLIYEGTFKKGHRHQKLLLTIVDKVEQRSAFATLKAW
jgi:hypothetical protein